MLEAQSVCFKVKDKHLIQDVSISVSPGEIVAIIGPNGAGKSTLLKVLAGELRPTAGVVRLDGHDMCDLTPPELASRRAVVPQATSLAFPFTVHEVVALGFSVPGFAGHDPKSTALVDNALERVDMAHLTSRSYTTLSGGERQRVHLARALCQLRASPNRHGTATLLLDEPTASLDLAHQLLILDEARCEAERGVAVLVVLHDLNLAADYADRIILLYTGKVECAGAPADVVKDTVLSRAFQCDVRTNVPPSPDKPFVLPQLCGQHGGTNGRRKFKPEGTQQ